MTDERSNDDSGDDEQSEESSDAEAINGDADDIRNTVAHDTQGEQLLKRHVKPQNRSSRALGHKPSRPRAQRRQAQSVLVKPGGARRLQFMST